MDGISLEPLKYYTGYARDKHKENVEAHFESLFKASGVNVEENRETVKKYDAELEKIKKLSSAITAYRVFFWIFLVIGIIGALILLLGIVFASSGDDGTGMIVGGVLTGLVGFLLAFLLFRRKIKEAEALRAKHKEAADKLYQEALSQMAPLNALFDDLDTLRLIEKTMPEVKFDMTYTNEAERKLIEEYDYIDMTDDNTSVVNALSGTLFENPFLFERYLSHEMGSYTYHGTLVISWTERYRDSKGNYSTRTRTQTLHASVVKPKPYYFTKTHLGFGSQVPK